MRFNEVSAPLPECLLTDFYTIVIDLTAPEETLFERIKKDSRNEIRRAQRDGVRYRSWTQCDAAVLEEFCSFYSRVASAAGMPELNRARLSAMTHTARVFLSCSEAPEGQTLTWHAYYVSGVRARLIHSASIAATLADASARNGAGHANRFHHWRDMMELKRAGMKLYDFGGWSPLLADEKRLGINRFKEEFGGTLIHQYNCLKGVSLVGKLAAAVYGRFNGYRRIASARPLVA